MNKFINIEVIKAQDKSHPSSQVKVEVTPDIRFFLTNEHFPFKVEIKSTFGNRKIYECNLEVNSWCSFDWFENSTLIVSTSKGIEIGRTSWNSIEHGAESEIAFDIWCAANPGTKGVAIGTNDGTSGEWVHLYHRQCFSKILLVEASDNTFLKLQQNYSHNQNVTLVNELITPNGGEIKFYEGGEGDKSGHTNSVDKDHVLKFFDDVKEVTKNSIGINELLINNGFQDLDWLHIDVEGLDDQLIMALDFDKINKPKVIVYEKVNNKNNILLEDFLHKNGYRIWVDTNNGFNNIAFLG